MIENRIGAALAAAAVAASCGVANAEVITAVQNLPRIAGIHLTLAWLSQEDGTPILEGEIIGARVYLDYTATNFFDGNPVDAADFSMSFIVPVPHPQGGSSQIFVGSEQTGWSGVGGDYTYYMESTAYNGTIVDGGFIDLTLLGDGTINAGSRIELDVLVAPAPGAGGVLAMGGLLATRRRRR